MKIMTYNILEGGGDDNGSRMSIILDVIRGANPDVIALQETYGFDAHNDELLRQVSDEIGLPYYAVSRSKSVTGDTRYHLSSLSRYPLRNVRAFTGARALCAVVDSPLGELSLCNVHLHAYSEEERARELRAVLKHQSRHKNNIILGDFNALSRADDYTDLSTKEFTHHGLTNFNTTDLLRSEYVDSAAYFKISDRKTHPTTGVRHAITETPVRIDYIFSSIKTMERAVCAEVIKTATASKASDHYPVTLTLV